MCVERGCAGLILRVFGASDYHKTKAREHWRGVSNPSGSLAVQTPQRRSTHQRGTHQIAGSAHSSIERTSSISLMSAFFLDSSCVNPCSIRARSYSTQWRTRPTNQAGTTSERAISSLAIMVMAENTSGSSLLSDALYSALYPLALRPIVLPFRCSGGAVSVP